MLMRCPFNEQTSLHEMNGDMKGLFAIASIANE